MAALQGEHVGTPRASDPPEWQSDFSTLLTEIERLTAAIQDLEKLAQAPAPLNEAAFAAWLKSAAGS